VGARQFLRVAFLGPIMRYKNSSYGRINWRGIGAKSACQQAQRALAPIVHGDIGDHAHEANIVELVAARTVDSVEAWRERIANLAGQAEWNSADFAAPAAARNHLKKTGRRYREGPSGCNASVFGSEEQLSGPLRRSLPRPPRELSPFGLGLSAGIALRRVALLAAVPQDHCSLKILAKRDSAKPLASAIPEVVDDFATTFEGELLRAEPWDMRLSHVAILGWHCANIQRQLAARWR
jgi:hypothetical protein